MNITNNITNRVSESYLLIQKINDSLLLIFALKEFNKYAEKRRRLGG